MDQIEKLRKMSEAGLSGSEAAREIGISRQRVNQVAKKHGISFADKRFLPRERPVSAPKVRVITGGVETPINHSVAGTICELLVAADLMARGWQVFMPIIASKGHDVIATKRERILTFEVRSASRNTAGNPVFAKKADCASDVYALVITGEPVIYDPLLPE